MLTKELALVKNSDIVFAVNAAEAEIFRRSANADVHVLGHAVRSEPELTAFRDRCDILFVGPLDDDVSPNVDSLVWFVREIMPLLELHLGSRLPAKRRRSKRIKCGEGLGRSTRLFPRRRPGSHAILRARPYLHRADALCGGSADEGARGSSSGASSGCHYAVIETVGLVSW
jgi:hypothetical protein